MNNHIPQPKFSVGEKVLRQAPEPYYTKFNGEYVVVSVMTKQEYENLVPGVLAIGDFYYTLDGLRIEVENLFGEKSGVVSSHTAERFLRKKHDGSEFTFDQLMSTLKQPCNA